MKVDESWCKSCARYTLGDVACAHCGQFRPGGQTSTRASGPRDPELEGVAIGIGLGIVVFFLWGLGNMYALGPLGGTGSSGHCPEEIFGVYTSAAARAYVLGLEIVTAVLAIALLSLAFYLVRKGNTRWAIALTLLFFVGLLPATSCDAGSVYGPC